MIHANPESIDEIILCGGLGKRLRSVINDRLKSMAEINGKPFLDILIEYVASFDFRHFILRTGYKDYVISEYIKEKYNRGRLDFLFIQEKESLGTGGSH